MGAESSSGITRRQFLVGGATGAASLWAASKLGWVARAEALPASLLTASPDDIGALPFADDFDQEFPGGLLTNWNVDRPIQVVGTTAFGVPAPANGSLDSTSFLAGHGLAVAMDGRIETAQIFAFRVGRLYTLSFDVAGSHHPGDPWPARLIASVPGGSAEKTVTRLPSDDFRRYRLAFRVLLPAASTIVFESGDAPGMAGLILDNVSLSDGDGRDSSVGGDTPDGGDTGD